MLNPKTIVKLSNSIGLFSILLLIFLVFGFIVSVIFNLQFISFRKDYFGISILAVLSLMAGALILNIMFNLSRIASRGEPVAEDNPQKVKRLKWILLSGFPLVALLLYTGDYYYKENTRLETLDIATQIQNQLKDELPFDSYAFSKKWIEASEKKLASMPQDFNDPESFRLFWQDTLNGNSRLFKLSAYYKDPEMEADTLFDKESYEFIEDREKETQLKKMLNSNTTKIGYQRLGSRNTETLIPIQQGNKKFVLEMTKYN